MRFFQLKSLPLRLLIAIVASVVPLQLASAGVILALTEANQLIRFDSSSPGSTSGPVNVSGLLGGDTLVGIDYRPANGQIYGFAVNGTIGRLYTINQTTGLATLGATINQAINGSFFGVDFNPVADRLRIISDAGQNLRVNVATGQTLVDGAIAYASTDVNAGTTPFVVASAYTNSFTGATSTTLYNIDVNTQSLVTQVPPNNGTLNTVGSLSEIAFAGSSFDIDGATNTGFVVLNGLDLASINLGNGNLSFLGSINSTSGIASITSVPEPTSIAFLGIAGLAGLARRHFKRSVNR